MQLTTNDILTLSGCGLGFAPTPSWNPVFSLDGAHSARSGGVNTSRSSEARIWNPVTRHTLDLGDA